MKRTTTKRGSFRQYLTVELGYPEGSAKLQAAVWRDMELPLGLLVSLRPDLLVMRAVVMSFVGPLTGDFTMTPEIVARAREFLDQVSRSFDSPAEEGQNGSVSTEQN